jgi:hypothetical protein
MTELNTTMAIQTVCMKISTCTSFAQESSALTEEQVPATSDTISTCIHHLTKATAAPILYAVERGRE